VNSTRLAAGSATESLTLTRSTSGKASDPPTGASMASDWS
jgi:hypothetical protein